MRCARDTTITINAGLNGGWKNWAAGKGISTGILANLWNFRARIIGSVRNKPSLVAGAQDTRTWTTTRDFHRRQQYAETSPLGAGNAWVILHLALLTFSGDLNTTMPCWHLGMVRWKKVTRQGSKKKKTNLGALPRRTQISGVGLFQTNIKQAKKRSHYKINQQEQKGRTWQEALILYHTVVAGLYMSLHILLCF